jgi:hypothetical protein
MVFHVLNRGVGRMLLFERLDNVPQFTQWLTGMQSRYQLRGMQEFRVNSGDNFYYEVFVVYELEPRPDAASGPAH